MSLIFLRFAQPFSRVFALFIALALSADSAEAAYPGPANDTSATAEAIGALPAIAEGSSVNGANDINTTTIGGLASVPGPDVFYSFTPAASGSYWVMMIPWHQLPVYGASGPTLPSPDLCVYIRRKSNGAFIAGTDANPRGQPETIVQNLTGGVEYEIIVDSVFADARLNQFDFTVLVAQSSSISTEDCTDFGSIAGVTYPHAVVGTLASAANDVTFVEGTGRCDVASTIGLGTAGRDHVWEFQTGPELSDAGEYMINLVPAGTAWNGYVYIVDSCPPFFPLGCFGAASHTSSTSNQAEAVVVSLDYDKKYYIVVDAATTGTSNARYALFIDRAEGYRITEVEPNDAFGLNSPLAAADQNGGQLVGPADADYFSISAAAGSRLYALVDAGNVLLSGLDSELRVVATNGSTVLEMDDDDGEGTSSPVATLVQRTSAFSSAVAGTPLLSTGIHYLLVGGDGTATNTIARYLVHYGIEPAGRAPSPECEPNDTLIAPDTSGKEYYSGVIGIDGDADYFTFSASAGQRVFVALDGDPERNSAGDEDNDAEALDGALAIYDPAGDILISDLDDPNLVGVGQQPDYPSETLAFVAPLAGTYKVRVTGGGAGDFGPGRTYHLAIFKNNGPPTITEGVDPVIDSITADFDADTLAVSASDDAPGDSGICALGLSGDSVNLQIDATFSNGDPVVSFTIELVDPGMSGYGKLIVTDCAGNTACEYVQIDATDPICSGANSVDPGRTFFSAHGPIHVPDNQPAGPGIIGTIDVPISATISDMDVTIAIETIYPLDIDVFLESPLGTVFEVVTDRGGTSSGFDITDATFDDSATELMSILSSDAPYTGRWRPEGAGGLAVFNGQNVLGQWKLRVRDDGGSSSTAGGGARLVRWSLEFEAGFPGPERFEGSATDTSGASGGIQSVVLNGATNVAMDVSDDFVPGDLSVSYVVDLINPSMNGGGTVTITDTSENTCDQVISLSGLVDGSAPANTGSVSRNIEIGEEVLQMVSSADPAGVVSSISIPDSIVVGEVEVDLTVDTLEIGRIASTLSRGADFAALLNRVSMDERGSVGLTKDNIEITLDDDSPVADDAHEEPALGTIEFLGLHQPDGRGEFIGDGITSDYRDNMMFALEGLDSAGLWSLYVADFRLQGAGSQRTAFRRWRAVVKSPGAPQRYMGRVTDHYPQAGICSMALGAGASNLSLTTSFTAGGGAGDYVVTLVDPAMSGSGTVEITDCAGNTAVVPIALDAALADQSLPVISGAVNPATSEFEGTASDSQPGDTGIVGVALAPWSTNLAIVSVTPAPPAAGVNFVVGLVNPALNGRGYVRVTDATGYRRHRLIHIDREAPVCTGFSGKSRRYVSTDLPQAISDDNPAGVASTIVVPDLAAVNDVDVTLNITHPFDDDMQVTLTSPAFLPLFGDIGSTGNDFINTTIDDEAAMPIPDSAAAAPFSGRFQPQGGPVLLNLDGSPAAGAYTLLVADDAVFNTGTFETWSLTIGSISFPERFQGEATDKEQFGLGIASIELLEGSCNVVLSTDAYAPGDHLVIYEVRLVDPAGCGRGTVRVTDMGGNACDQIVALNGAFCGPGDVNHDGVTNFLDVEPFVAALLAGMGNCEADTNLDGSVNGLDAQGFVDALSP